MFVAGALIPSTLLALLSFRHVTGQLDHQNSVELKQFTKNYAFSLYERLLIADNDLRTAASLVQSDFHTVQDALPVTLKRRLHLHFDQLTLYSEEDGYLPVLNPKQEPAHFLGKIVFQKKSPKTRLEIITGSTGFPEIYMLLPLSLPLGGVSSSQGVLIGSLSRRYLWDMEASKSLPFQTDSYISYRNKTLYTTMPEDSELPAELRAEMEPQTSGSFETVLANGKYLVGYWSLFLKSDFSSPSWDIVLLRSRRDVLAPVKSFQSTLFLIFVITLLLVLLLSLSSLQKILKPLEKLKEATGRIADRDFHHKVTLAGNDEFSELAGAFNVMSGELDRQFIARAKLLQELKDLNWGSLIAFSRTVDAKSSWTAGHSARVTRVALEIAKAMHMDDKDRDTLHRASLLHDIGKIGIPVKVLDKPGKLTPDEFEAIKSHPAIGARILEPIQAYREVIPIVRQHHEQYGGKGYPDGLKGDDISFGGRILAVADTYDACVSDRPYRKGMDIEKALQILTRGSGSQFDPEVVRVFVRLYSTIPQETGA